MSCLLPFFIGLSAAFALCPPPWKSLDGTNRCFQIHEEREQFNVATVTCRNEGGHLVSIHNQAENQQLNISAHEGSSDGTSVWIGLLLSSTKELSWDDGSPVNYTNWSPGYPLSTGAHCASMNMDLGHTVSFWQNDGQCDDPKRFICQMIPDEEKQYCEWRITADIYLFVDATAKAASFLPTMKSFGKNFYSGLNIGNAENQVQSVTNMMSGNKLMPPSFSLSCNDPVYDINKLLTTKQLQLSYVKSLSSVNLAHKRPQYGGRVLGDLNTYVIYYTTQADGSDLDDDLIRSADALKKFGIRTYVIFFGPKPPVGSQVYNFADKLLVVGSDADVQSVVRDVWTEMCRNANLINLNEVPVEPNLNDIATFDLVIVRDNSNILDAQSYNQVKEGVVSIVNSLNSGFQKVAYIAVQADSAVVSTIDTVCKSATLANVSALAQGSSREVVFKSALPLIKVKLHGGVHLREGAPLIILFISSTKASQPGYRDDIAALKSEHEDFHVVTIPIFGDMPSELSGSECKFIASPSSGYPIADQFEQALKWLKERKC